MVLDAVASWNVLQEGGFRWWYGFRYDPYVWKTNRLSLRGASRAFGYSLPPS